MKRIKKEYNDIFERIFIKKGRLNIGLISTLMLVIVIGLSIGYSAFSSNLNISGIVTQIRIKKDVRVTGVSMVPETEDSEDSICSLESGTAETIGAQYTCSLDQDRTFYVLGENASDSNKIDLIMNENYVDDTVPAVMTWCASVSDNSCNHDGLDPYIEHIQGVFGDSVTVSLPTYDQIYKAAGNKTSGLPLWLYGNLYTDANTSLPDGYWTSTANSGVNVHAWVVTYDGTLYGNNVNGNSGLRPVITISKSQLGEASGGVNNNGGSTTYLEYNVSNIEAGLTLPSKDSSVTLNVQITNIGNAEVGIKEITGLPDNLTYELLDYNLKDKICVDDVCKNGIVKEITLKIKYKTDGYDSSNTTYNVVANFDFQQFYSVTYTDITNNDYPTEIIGGETLEVDFGDDAPSGIIVKIDDVETSNYTYEDGILTIENINGNVEIKKNYFADDSWETIVANVKEGNTSNYNVGDTKEITLTSTDTNIAGTYTVRIANTSTPEECATDGFSQTACGFVIEFVDIITNKVMNSLVTNVGGWEASEMRSYVNNEIYNSLPEILKNSIIDTTVVSGHGSTTGETNFTTTDKLYLLSTKEVFENGTSNTIDYDTAREVTRQLDYYKNQGVTTNNYSATIKTYNGSNASWWLRSANYYITNQFFRVNKTGLWNDYDYGSNPNYGVAPAFRIGIEATESESEYICNLESGTSKTTSAQYTCTLDQDRTFYVLGENASDSTKIDLIMDRNYIDDTVPTEMTWCVSGDDNSCNHDNLDPYIEHIQGVFGNSVIVSLPTGQQIATAGGDTNWTDSNYTGYVLPLWLYDNLFSESNDSLPYGYWTSTSVSGSISEAWKVCYDGSLYINYVYDGLNSNGIRPVITISKSSMN